MTVDRLPEDADWLQEKNLQALLSTLGRDGAVARVVGGAVRNALVGLPVFDIDIATEFEPDVVAGFLTDVGFRVIETGKDHGTLTALKDGYEFQVTTLRVDVRSHGRHADVAFTRNWEADAARRDFTINAIYADADGALHDPFDGRHDLAAGRVRFIGDADKRVAEDYLRILRFFRFTASFGDGPADVVGLAACIRGRGGVAGLSAERVRAELLKLLAVKDCSDAVEEFAHTGILNGLLGGVVYPGALARLCEIEESLSLEPDPLLRLMALAVRVHEDVTRLARRLRLSNVEVARMKLALDEVRHLSPGLREQGQKEALYRLGAPAFSDRVLSVWAVSSGIAASDWQNLWGLPKRWPAPKFPLRGEDLLARGFEPGPTIGEILKRAESLWIAADYPVDEAVLEALLSEATAKS